MAEEPPVPSGDFSPEIEERIRIAFQSVLDAAVPAYEIGQLQLFHDEDESYLQREVERMLYEPQLPNGGDRERRMIDRLKKLSKEKDWAGANRAEFAITQWEKVLPDNPRNPGRYYIRKPLTQKSNKEEMDWLKVVRDSAHENKFWDKKWFAQMMLDGLPEPVSNFNMECLFLLRKSDGSVDRLVRLKSVLGESSRGQHHKGAIILDEDAFAAPEKFRKWAMRWGNFAWKGNQTDLHKLHEDVANISAWKVINRVDSIGWLPLGGRTSEGLQKGIWFLSDCAYADGHTLSRDEDGIYWYQTEGYYLNNKGRETKFSQEPFLTPDLHLARSETKAFILTSGPRDRAIERDFFREVCSKFYDTVGSYEGWLILGAMFSYAAAPEIFAEFGLFPGLFIHGEFESGKTLLTSWAMRLWGFRMSSGIGLLKGTPVGLLCESENYSNLPLWVDEFRAGKVNEDKEAILRDCYNRQPQSKWSADGTQRVMKTSFIVSGESTSSDSAMQSRFPHVQVSKLKRIGNHLEWMTANKDKFFIFGRILLERRAEFVATMRGLLDEWMGSPQMAGVAEREKMVHGLDWAAMSAMCALIDKDLPMDGALELNTADAFLRAMVDHAKGSASEIKDESNIMIFLQDLLTAFKADAVPKECFRMEYTVAKHPPFRPNQNGGWKSYRLFIDPNQAISHVQIYLTKHRGQITLSRKDLKAQLSKLACWIDGPHVKRFGPSGDTSTVKAWGFELDKLDLGYQPCTDAEYEAHLLSPEEGDPRMGPFYAIIFALENREREIAKATR